MGGALSLAISVFSVTAFVKAGAYSLAVVAAFVSLVDLWSWLHMWYFARMLARQRLFVTALHRGEFAENSPEAERYWREVPVRVEERDVLDVPNWITTVNMGATVVAVVLSVWGIILWLS